MNQSAEVNLSENCVLTDAISESATEISLAREMDARRGTLVVSRSWNPLSTLLLSFAHFANWSWALVAINCALVDHVVVLSSR